MPVYRYSEAGAQRIFQRVRRQSLLITGLSLLAATAIALLNGGPVSLPISATVVVFMAIVFLWVQRRSAGRIRRMIDGTEIELGENLIGRNPDLTVTIQPGEVKAFQSTPAGLLIRGPGVRQMLQLSPDLEHFDDLRQRLEKWVPASVPRTHSSVPMSNSITLVGIASLILLVAAFTLSGYAGIAACLLASLLLVSCCLLIWTNKAIATRFKLSMLITLLPCFALLTRASLLWRQMH